jgi:putative ATP-dependent endonuclease of OLD family
MRIESIAIKNLRCIKDDVLHLDPYTCLVGPNGAGKSTFLHALNIFFRHSEDSPTDVTVLTTEDFHMQDTIAPIDITITFSDLNKEASEDFKGYVRQGKLVVSAKAIFDAGTGRAEVKHFGKRLGMAAFGPFFQAYGDHKLVPELTMLFDELEKNFPELAAKKTKKTKDGMYAALREFENDRPDDCELLDSDDLFYGVSKGFDKFDKHVQWIFIPAVKDATDEVSETKTGALGKLLARTVRSKVNFAAALDALVNAARQQYQKMLDDNEAALREVSEALRERLMEWAHPYATIRVAWQQDSSKAVRVDQPVAGILAGESGFEGSLARLGHGFQRSYLLALLQELASAGDKNAPTLILGCEEPELYQHPPQARYLASIFERLSGDGSQVIVSTHSPYFVSGRYFESVRLVGRGTMSTGASARQFSFATLANRFAQVVGEPLKKEPAAMSKLHQALQPAMNEMFFTKRLVLVEGLEDAAYIHSWLFLRRL